MYLYIKALHVIAVVVWMAGLLFCRGSFAYDAAATPGCVHSGKPSR